MHAWWTVPCTHPATAQRSLIFCFVATTSHLEPIDNANAYEVALGRFELVPNVHCACITRGQFDASARGLAPAEQDHVASLNLQGNLQHSP